MKWLSLVCLLSLLGCSSYLTPPEATTSLREYSINDLHVVVGAGEWGDNTFIIHSFDGQQWKGK